jgi:subtilase family serine protease
VSLHPYYKRSKKSPVAHLKARAAGSGPWTVPQLLARLGFTQGSLPGGGTIGILELGGGIVASDTAAAFKAANLPAPTVSDVSVDGTTNQGANGGDANMECALDLQVAGMVYAWLTGKAAKIDMLWSQSIETAATKSASLGHAACSCSWGDYESAWGASELAAMQAALVTCTNAGTTFFAASGDNDADDGDGSGKPSVDAPASCTNAVACGGASVPQSGAIVIWNNNPGNANGEGTGGGYSQTFPFASWCSGPSGSGRMVSDVAGCADPDTGIEIIVGGQQEVVGGTSAVSPFWSGIRAALGPQSTKLGDVNALLWSLKAQFAAVTTGTNGTFPADVCCGLGMPTQSLLTTLESGAAPAPPAPAPTPPPTTGVLTAAQVADVQAAMTVVLGKELWLMEKNQVAPQLAAAIAALGPVAAP